MSNIQEVKDQVGAALKFHREMYVRLSIAWDALNGKIEEDARNFTLVPGVVDLVESDPVDSSLSMSTEGNGTLTPLPQEPVRGIVKTPEFEVTGATVKPAAKRPKRPKAGQLPNTGGDWFMELVSKRPQSRAEIMAAAVEKLGFTPAAAQRKQLQDRLSDWLSRKVKQQVLKTSMNGKFQAFALR
jgi:hypothetical protein